MLLLETAISFCINLQICVRNVWPMEFISIAHNTKDVHSHDVSDNQKVDKIYYNGLRYSINKDKCFAWNISSSVID